MLGCLVTVPAAAAQDRTAPPAPGSWVVTLQDGAPIDAVAAAAGAPVRQRFTQALTGFSAALTEAQLTKLEADPRVRSVTENTVVARAPRRPRVVPAPSTQFVPEGVRRVGGAASPTARIDGVDRALDADVAVIDTGVAPHPDLTIADTKDCTGENLATDPFGHGTEVAGVAAARDNRVGTVGVAPGARIWNVRVFDQFGTLSLDSLLCGLEHVRKNAGRIDTAIMAFGNEGERDPRTVCGITTGNGRERGRTKYEVVDPVDLALCRGTLAGVTFVASAGNDSRDAAGFVPAAYPQVITVSAMTDTDGKPGGRGTPAFCYPTEGDDTFASYSNYGRVVDLAAPGTCSYTTFPGNQYTTDIGTSFAAPLVAGAVALIRARNPRATPVAIAGQLQSTKERRALPGDPDGVAEGILNVARY